jgi:hypothetical protein
MVGASGMRGATGTGLSIVAHMRCSKLVTQLFEYQTVEFSDGSLLVSCSVSGAAIQAHTTQLYAAEQNGADTGGCLVTYDVDGTASGGYWNFTLSPRRALYNDAGSANDQQAVTFASADCQ